MRVVALICLGCLILAGCGGTAEPSRTHRARPTSHATTAANGPVVLGAKNFIVWGGIGFGTAHPTKLVVGGDPSVLISRIRWRGWGDPKASGIGRYAVPRIGSGGSYYRETFRAELRVSGIGRCHPNGPRTYMALAVRVALQPGQRPSWYQAAGSHGLCSYP
jgi:hypothetical protein